MGYLGQSVARFEDDRLLSGRGRYVADMSLPGRLDAVFVRSSVAHGRLRSVDPGPAREIDGVEGAWGAAELPDLPDVPAPGGGPALAKDEVRYVGQPLAVVVGRDRYTAEDGADEVLVNAEPLPAAVDIVETASDSAGISGDHSFGEPIDDGVWADAPVVVEARYQQQLLAPTSIEARAVLAAPRPDGGLTVWCSHQASHRLRDALSTALADTLPTPPPAPIEVIVDDVGGAFGAKSGTYPEYVVVAFLALRLGRPVRWIEDRAEALRAATRGRGQRQTVRLAADHEGRFLALQTDLLCYGGPAMMTPQMAPGAYAIPKVHSRARGVATNTGPMSAYRGAGRPEAAYAIERTVDTMARKLGMDPAELRRRNLIPPDAFPHETPTGRVYDSGNYAAALDKALELVDYQGWRGEQERRRSSTEDAPLGIGISCYMERSGGAPGSTEYGSVEACPDGSIVARCGSQSTGQGHETVFAQIVASVLEVGIERIRVIEGDTSEVPEGTGSFGSRSLQVGGSALHQAAVRLVGDARRRVATRAEVPEGEVGFRDGVVTAGTDSIPLAQVAAESGPLRADEVFSAPQAFPYGCHIAVVEVDPELGNVRILRLAGVDDFGRVINPMLVMGQRYGSIAQGIGQALYEEAGYDSDGNPQADSLFHYLIPTFSEIPDLVLDRIENPNPNTTLGAKGAGESGCIGTPPAIANAVVDALRPNDPDALQLPLTPETCWLALMSGAVPYTLHPDGRL